MVKYITKKGNKYYPTKDLKKKSWVSDKKIYKLNPIKFWEEQAKNIDWEKDYKTAYKEKLPYFKWFVGGKLNASVNCLDRHLEKDKPAIIWVPEPTKEKPLTITYKELHEKVSRFANVLKKLKVKKGDVVGIYLPMIPEVAIAMLACSRIGAIHSVVFSAFSADALKTRLKDGGSKVLITSDGYFRKGKKENLLKKAEEAIKGTKVKKVVVVPRIRKSAPSKYIDFNKEIKKVDAKCEPKIMKSEDTLFILYTSGTTGNPKGVMHDTGGYLTQALTTTKWNFNLHENDVIWCTADVGWITGHTYAIYGPLLNGSTALMFEGSPDYPNFGRWWFIVDKHKVTAFYTAPTAIRLFMKKGEKYLKKYKLNSLKILGTVGEPIDADAWNWYFKKVGKSRIPIIDTWWQTETGANVINSLPGIGPFIPSYAGKPFPGIRMQIVNDKGNKVKENKKGNLVMLSPFAPGMLHGVFKNKKRYKDTYWSRFKNKYDTSDGAYYDKDGNIRITGRMDDVIKVAGHRLSTAEMENALDEDEFVNEAAVVAVPDKLRGEVPVAFVVLEKGEPSDKLKKKLIMDVRKKIGPIATPKEIYFVDDLPKTRSGKIMRRILKNLIMGEQLGGISTLLNPESIESIKEKLVA
jgi:acetyl-CoA synthetase